MIRVPDMEEGLDKCLSNEWKESQSQPASVQELQMSCIEPSSHTLGLRNDHLPSNQEKWTVQYFKDAIQCLHIPDN